MQMIDVMKRLAELDASNPRVVKESINNVAECGMMPMPGMGGSSHTPASINMTADSGSELTGMLRDIMQLAGMHQVEPSHLGIEPSPMSLTPEPIAAVGPAIAEPLSGADTMRSVLDKLNPEPAGDEQGDDLGPFQHDSDDEGGEEEPEGDNGNPFGGDDVSADHGDIDDDGDHDMDDHDAEDDEKEPVEEYDNTPSDPNSAEPFDSNQFANQENQPGTGDRMDGTSPKARVAFENLMKEYKSFIGETTEETDEGIMDKAKAFGKKVLDKVGHGDDEDMIKDLQKKVGVPQTGKKPEKQTTNESLDILKLAGLRRL
jgi:hypothetical protein